MGPSPVPGEAPVAPGQHDGPMRQGNPVPRQPSLADALIPLATLALLIGGSLALFGLDALDGPDPGGTRPVLRASRRSSRQERSPAGRRSRRPGRGRSSSVTSAVFILLAVGALIGAWNLSGTIPTLVYYGIQVLSPGWYYAATALICGVVALSIGSSWTTAGDDRRRPGRHRRP